MVTIFAVPVGVAVVVYYLVTTTQKKSIIRIKKFQSSRSLEEVQLHHAKKLAELDNLDSVDLKNRVNRSSSLDYYFFKEEEIDDNA